MDWMGPPESGDIEGFVASSTGVSSASISIFWGLGKIGETTFANTVTVK